MHITALQIESLIMLSWQICGSVVWQDLLSLFFLSPSTVQQPDNCWRAFIQCYVQ